MSSLKTFSIAAVGVPPKSGAALRVARRSPRQRRRRRHFQRPGAGRLSRHLPRHAGGRQATEGACIKPVFFFKPFFQMFFKPFFFSNVIFKPFCDDKRQKVSFSNHFSKSNVPT